jgi:cardiolipin synthase
VDTPDWLGLVTFLVVALTLAFNLGMKVLALGVIPGNRKPSTGMAWLLIVMLSPLVGFIAFVFFGRAKLERSRHERQHEVNDRLLARTAEIPDLPLDPDLPPYVGSVVRLNRVLCSIPLMVGNDVELEPDYEGSIQHMAEAVATASDYVNVEFYITAWDEVTAPLFDQMVAATERGVTVRLLFDHLGSRGIPGYQDMLTRLRATKILWHPMLPVRLFRGSFRRPDLRNHRKLLVVDGRIGFTGSQNLTEPGYNKPKNHAAGREWVELMVRLQGPVVATLDAVFSTDWYTETGEIVPVEILDAPSDADPAQLPDVPCPLVRSGPGIVAENNLRMFTTLIYGATRRLSLTSPYFVPDESLLYAVTTAAQRGVEVELFVSEQSDQFMVGHAQASYYRALLEAGVAIHLYPAPYVLHGKHFTVDDDVAVIGSSNMDMRSFALNYEISLMLLGRDVVARMRTVEDSYRALSRRLTMEEWDRRPARHKYVDNVMRLTAALQ